MSTRQSPSGMYREQSRSFPSLAVHCHRDWVIQRVDPVGWADFTGRRFAVLERTVAVTYNVNSVIAGVLADESTRSDHRAIKVRAVPVRGTTGIPERYTLAKRWIEGHESKNQRGASSTAEAASVLAVLT